jgi:hypothetical protein
MHMLGLAISKIQKMGGIFRDLWCAMVLTLKKLYSNIIALGTDLMTHIAQSIKFLFAKIKLSIGLCRARFIIVELLIRAGLLVVLRTLGRIGTQLAKIACKIRQHVLSLLKQGS